MRSFNGDQPAKLLLPRSLSRRCRCMRVIYLYVLYYDPPVRRGRYRFRIRMCARDALLSRWLGFRVGDFSTRRVYCQKLRFHTVICWGCFVFHFCGDVTVTKTTAEQYFLSFDSSTCVETELPFLCNGMFALKTIKIYKSKWILLLYVHYINVKCKIKQETHTDYFYRRWNKNIRK